MKTIVIAGATGMIGKALSKKLMENYNIINITRDIKKSEKILGYHLKHIHWNDTDKIKDSLEEAYGIINLAGYNLGKSRWSKKIKHKILKSRINCSLRLKQLINATIKKPEFYIQASAIGYYTSDLNKEYTELDVCRNNFFLNYVCRKWEAAAYDHKDNITKYIIIRSGIVLDKKEGFIPKLIRQYKYYLGGNIGKDNQWLSWIHIDDHINAILFLIENKTSNGIYNLTSPFPVKYRELSRNLSLLMNRKNWLNIPEWLVKIILGQMGKETVLSSLRVLPNKLMDEGFKFKYSDINKTLKNLVD